MTKKASRKTRQDYRDEPVTNGKSSVVPFPAKKSKARKAAAGYQKADEMDAANPLSAEHRAPLVCKTKAQTIYRQNIEANTISFGVGPAGTGKSFVAVKVAAKMIDDGLLQKIIFTRPAVGVDEELGAIPGTLDEKCRPWFEPLLEILYEHWGQSHVEGMIHSKKIRFIPLSHMRGRTFKNAIIMLDEAQNATVRQMNAVLTRFGEYSKVVVDGDIRQIDINKPSGLLDALKRFTDAEGLSNVNGISISRFTRDDVVRHGLIKDILDAYDREI